MKVSFLRPNITEADIQRTAKALRTGWLVHGKYTNLFEKELDKFLGNQEKHVPYGTECGAAKGRGAASLQFKKNWHIFPH
jgi:dTDP-4-amino-4,6-dideoxygalactose transaminase